EKAGDADVGRHVPDSYGDFRGRVFHQQRAAILIVDRGEVEDATRTATERPGDPQCDSIALDEFVERRVDRLDEVVARGQPIRAGEEIAVGLLYGVVGMHDLGGQPARFAAQQIIAVDPGDR